MDHARCVRRVPSQPAHPRRSLPPPPRRLRHLRGAGLPDPAAHPAGALRPQGEPAVDGARLHLRALPHVPRAGPDLLRLLQPLDALALLHRVVLLREGRLLPDRVVGAPGRPRLRRRDHRRLQWLLKYTDFGLGVRALAQHKDAAGLMGVNDRRTSAYVYAVYVGISAMTGVLIGTILSVSAKMGPEYTIFAFFVVVLAGMGYLAGVPAAAFLLGIIQSIFLVYLDPGYTLLAVFAVLYLILLVSPTGLFRKGV